MFRILVCILVGFGIACQDPKESSNPTMQNVDGSDYPSAGEEDWEWEIPTFDASIPMHTDLGVPMDAGITTCDASGSQPSACDLGQRIGDRLVISVSSGLIPNCLQGHIIHLWDERGEHRSLPDQSLVITRTDWYGYVGFNVTCGTDWSTAPKWDQYSVSQLMNAGLLSISIDGKDQSEKLDLCPYAQNSITIPVIPVECRVDPC